MSEVRPLPFPLNYAQSLTALVEEGSEVFNLPSFPEDSNERIDVIANLSLNEFVRLATAIDVGSDIAYGEEAVAIWYTWVRSIMSESLCEKIEGCIETSQGVRDAIGAIFTSDIDTPQYEQLLEKLQEDLEQTITPTTNNNCNDKLWGACIQFVEILNRNALDYLELLETAPVEQALEIVNSIANAPLLDEVGLDALTATVSWAVDQLFDYYVASFTDEYRDALACEVFCRVKDTCGISVNDFYEVLKDRASVSVLEPSDIVAVAISIAQITFSGATDRVCDVWLYWNLELARLGNLLANSSGLASAFGFGNAMTRLKTQVKLGLNNPDSDWVLLCDCAVIEYENVFTWGIARWKIQGETTWNDVAYTIINPSNGIPCGVLSLPLNVTVEYEKITSAAVMGLGWRDIWVQPPQPPVKVRDFASSNSYYWITTFVNATPPNDVLCLEVGSFASSMSTRITQVGS